jgi:exodeoxyribonuclease-3
MTLRLLALNIANPSPTRAQLQLAWLRERPEDVLVLSETKNSKGSAQLLVGLQEAGGPWWPRHPARTATESRWPAAYPPS